MVATCAAAGAARAAGSRAALIAARQKHQLDSATPVGILRPPGTPAHHGGSVHWPSDASLEAEAERAAAAMRSCERAHRRRLKLSQPPPLRRSDACMHACRRWRWRWRWRRHLLCLSALSVWFRDGHVIAPGVAAYVFALRSTPVIGSPSILSSGGGAGTQRGGIAGCHEVGRRRLAADDGSGAGRALDPGGVGRAPGLRRRRLWRSSSSGASSGAAATGAVAPRGVAPRGRCVRAAQKRRQAAGRPTDRLTD
jgi:hypothetical protein